MIPFRTWLVALNFILLQWLGVRLARVVERQRIPGGEIYVALGVLSEDESSRTVTVGWRVLRWIVPLTGWWSDYRYFARSR